MREKSDGKPASGGLGTFGGVFTPSVLTILGIILFRRLGYVVGSAGLGHALIIIGVSCALSILTSVSLAASATNLRVKGGGLYYVISRTLGVEFGGAIGIVLVIAQSVSIAFYCIGFGEAVAGMLPAGGTALPQIIAALAVAFLFIFAWLGADWATRLQYVVMTVLVAALASFFAGGLMHWDRTVLVQNWATPASSPSFWVLFAIFFPAVTGFTQGVSMSGDLKDASKSITIGTFLAVGISTVVYLGTAVVFAAASPREVLIEDYDAMRRVAHVNWLVDGGVIAATLSSAMASFLGAPRILQSIARDRIFPFLQPFAQGTGPAENPRRGVLLSAVIAFATIGLGNLNLIAPVVSMFFLISYGLLNYATFYEARAASPSFRPRFRWFDARLSLVGAVGCLAAMVAIDLPASVVAIAVLFAVYEYLQRTAGPARWADSRRSYHFQRVREHLLAVAAEPEHPRDWRPRLLVFSKDTRRREYLLRFSSWIEGGSGFTTVVRILEGEGERLREHRAEAEADLQADIAEHDLKAFALVVATPDLFTGTQTLIQSFGIGPIRANTVLLNWIEQLPEDEDPSGERRYGRYLRAATRLGCNVVVLDAKEGEWAALEALPPEERRIDVWWWGNATSRLMLLLAYLMTRTEEWSGSKIRVLAPAGKRSAEKVLEGLRQTLEEVRIHAEAEVVVEVGLDEVVQRSADASLLFLPLHFRGDQPRDPFGGRLEDMLSRLPVVALGLAAEDIHLDVEPEEGKVAEVAAALDAAADAEKAAQAAEKEAAKAAEVAEQKLRDARAEAGDVEESARSEIVAAAREAEDVAKRAAREAARARAKAEAAAQAAETIEAKPRQKDEEAAPRASVQGSEASESGEKSPSKT
jgi:amino acid transporter